MELRLHHAAISVSDLERSKAFYAELGFQPVVDWADPSGSPKICHMKLGDSYLELFWFEAHLAAPESAGQLQTDLPRIGCKHFALRVDSIDEAKAFVEDKGWAAGVAVLEGRTGVRYFFVPDPDGILVEFVEDRRGL
ncbi:MAG TPA: VOC family protein [Actinomycetota bacterium]|nr:VOC family protein [Actinomycetota bacterium]